MYNKHDNIIAKNKRGACQHANNDLQCSIKRRRGPGTMHMNLNLNDKIRVILTPFFKINNYETIMTMISFPERRTIEKVCTKKDEEGGKNNKNKKEINRHQKPLPKKRFNKTEKLSKPKASHISP
jgi:hypothetical protein